MKRATSIMRWDRFVDAITVIWLGVFVLGFLVSSSYKQPLEYIAWGILSVFVVDLYLVAKRSQGPVDFFKHHWFDILMVIPYLRPLRIFRLARLARLTRSLRFTKLTAVARTTKVLPYLHEGADVVRTIKTRRR